MTRLKRSCEDKLLTTPAKDKTEFNMKIESPKLCKDIQRFKKIGSLSWAGPFTFFMKYKLVK